ncbi:helix-turn-helix transcriptional regulator [Vibrio parahaemolyticus]|uniref:helix-turn-helix domain-containing protein n=4 Tax=Vibrio parahaemolyticus TaxID=670 RepID=UPI001C5F4269|nr:helix-turn-helix transcriptional regulator [Vibrio parahaemolyticus]EJE4205056.1 helix-turn-helix transcriptional regulator [Vibrio parahaemolyticus]MCF9030135.1 helix-turn-helix transcriptional regulator [Vibrio parahaemolyticus]MCZ6418656.1 helix-turn-helix transcriptional regulator [Vibrio parahaemolyticus]MDF4857269.1 helix-turn-helix transcriptional regulator [Vibrio parahaemolyticus]MDF5208787.1 helix-turn-helix transcriptional regulator [Vibrio parahaemolyticus]
MVMNARSMFYSKDTHYSDAEDRAFARDELVYNVTEDLLVIMEDKGISKTELSRRLGKSKSYVSQVLSGSRNMTLGSFSDICFALGFKPEVNLPVEDKVEEDENNYFEFIIERPSASQHIKKIHVVDNLFQPEVLSWQNYCDAEVA